MENPKAFIIKQLEEFSLKEVGPILDLLDKETLTHLELAGIMNFLCKKSKLVKAYSLLNVRLETKSQLDDIKETLSGCIEELPAKQARPLIKSINLGQHTTQDIADIMNTLVNINNLVKVYAIMNIKLKEVLVETSIKPLKKDDTGFLKEAISKDKK